MDCKELIQSLPDESEFELCADGSGSLYFNFMNCLRLNQKAVSNFFRDLLLKMQLMGTEKIISLFERGLVEGSICFPGSEIPEWFSYKNKGSSINIPVLRNDCGRSSYIMGFAVCLVFVSYRREVKKRSEPSFDEGELNLLLDFHLLGHKERLFHNPFPLFRMPIEVNNFTESDHILLGYNLSSKCYEFFQELDTPLANHSMSDYVGISFEFKHIRDKHEVKYCGIQPIYVQVLQKGDRFTLQTHLGIGQERDLTALYLEPIHDCIAECLACRSATLKKIFSMDLIGYSSGGVDPASHRSRSLLHSEQSTLEGS
ncbi:hypothetical protein LWI29_001979 [Acer saccharum]|uniref:C-JID domain-containing protein n=1 Tax=Acer saccharum TaxID=4024 RepID=A0AA39RPN5_ACESA|nr:hypothetical protein LWI29_001979 [Acer saccharum]